MFITNKVRLHHYIGMPQRAPQRMFGKGLKLHLAKQKKQKLELTYNYEVGQC